MKININKVIALLFTGSFFVACSNVQTAKNKTEIKTTDQTRLHQKLLPVATLKNDPVVVRSGNLKLHKSEYDRLWNDYLLENNQSTEPAEILRKTFNEQLKMDILLSNQARLKKLDKTSDFQARKLQAENKLLVNLLKKQMRNAAKVNEEEIKKYYDTKKDEFTEPGRVQVLLIQTDTEDDATTALMRLEKGEDFSELATEISTHASKEKGGVLAPFARGTYPETFEKIAFKIGIGKTSPVIKTESGWQIIKKTAEQPALLKPYENVADAIRKKLIDTKFQRDWKQMLEKLQRDQKIKIEFPELEI